MSIQELYDIFIQYPTISTDTRNIAPNSLFFALKGDTFNANSFAAQALEKGASYAIIDEPSYANGEQYIVVPDVLATLQQLAYHHRQQLTIPFIGITGTNGKTTTKELLNRVLSEQFKTYATQGNLNNHIGVPLTILAIDASIEIAIIEMGANHIGEIALLSAIACPTQGLITNVGKAHLEGFGSFEGVIKTKGELYDYLKANNGTTFLQGENAYLQEMAQQRALTAVVLYGHTERNHVIGNLLRANPYLSISWHLAGESEESIVETQLTGAYNVENMLAAAAVGNYFGMSTAAINAGLAAYVPRNNRSQLTKTTTNLLIADYYNANASSMHAALENIDVIEGSKKVVILGDMFEMGDESQVEHQRVIDQSLALAFNRLIFVGHAFYALKSDAAEFYETTAVAITALQEAPVKDALVLLKASRGMAFEQLMPLL